MIIGPRTGPLDDDQLLEAYPWPDRERPWVRAMMVTTLDGAAAGPDGLSGSISSSVDKSVFDAVRRLADAVLVGAGTIRTERYGPMRGKPADAERRALAGQAAAPVVVIVSGSLDLDWHDRLFTESTMRPLVITGSQADRGRLDHAGEHCDVVVTDTESVDPATVLEVLEQRGLRRIVCEGGPTLLESFVAAGLLDEADITISPTFAGTAQTPRTSGLD
ncbi:MAG: dihydrofolate reductase family protein, partial [Aeromicrobium sp.]